MAILNNADFTAYKRALRRTPAHGELQALELSKPVLQAVFQALEDGYTSRRAAIKAEMDAAAGQALSVSVAKAIEDLWMARNAGRI